MYKSTDDDCNIIIFEILQFSINNIKNQKNEDN